MMKQNNYPTSFPAQHETVQPGIEHEMNPTPISDNPSYISSNKLKGKVAIITGGDSGIGKAVAILFAKEGANVAIAYLNEDNDAKETKRIIESYGGKCLCIKGDLSNEDFCHQIVEQAVSTFSGVNILVNNAAVQFPQKRIEDITAEQLHKTFATNIFPMFYLSKACLSHMKAGDAIINTASITAYRGHEQLIDYASTKGAIVSFTRSLSMNLSTKGIRVNAVAPGPIWTPLIPSSFDALHVATFGKNTPMQRAGQPIEVAPAYLYLASEESSYISGQVIHVNGGEIVNG
jgi:NAD(P)-dependent dehydrogenase (short-subunit alcohol dehydrogenase family)